MGQMGAGWGGVGWEGARVLDVKGDRETRGRKTKSIAILAIDANFQDVAFRPKARALLIARPRSRPNRKSIIVCNQPK